MDGGKIEGYQTNPEQQDFPDFDLVYKRWSEGRGIKAPSQIKMYERISNVWCVGKTVTDVGCGIGVGTHIIGYNALGVLGVDSNPKNVDVAKSLYETPTIKFEEYNVFTPPERPIAGSDVVTCIEVIEHVDKYDEFLDGLKKFHDPKRRTVFFISSPNRNSDKLGQDKPNNINHVREFTAGEFYEILTKHFQSVVLFSVDKLNTFEQEETIDGSAIDTPILAKCEGLL